MVGDGLLRIGAGGLGSRLDGSLQNISLPRNTGGASDGRLAQTEGDEEPVRLFPPTGGQEDEVQVSQSALNQLARDTEARREEDARELEENRSSLKDSLEGLDERSKKHFEKLSEEVTKKLDGILKVRFDRDEDTGTDYFQLIEKQSGDVVRQFPAEEVIEAIRNIQEVRSLFVSEQA